MPHAVDAVVDYVVATVTGLTTTGANVFRQRVYDVDDGSLPALLVYMGNDVAIGESGRSNIAYIDSALEVRVEIKAKNTADLDGALTGIRAEIEAAFSAAYSSKPASVIDFWQSDAAEPETAEGETRKGSMILTYAFHYRRAQ